MNFPGAGDKIADFAVESVEVGHQGIGTGVRVFLKHELERFLAYLEGQSLSSSTKGDSMKNQLIGGYLKNYQSELERRVRGYKKA